MDVHSARAMAALTDAHADARKASQQCPRCFYLRQGIVSGQAFTRAVCESCGENMTFATTDTDLLCLNCAVTYGCCKHCGADFNMRQRKKL